MARISTASMSELYMFQQAVLEALDLKDRLVTDIKIHVPIDDFATVTVEMIMTEEIAEKLLKIDWKNAPTRTTIVLEKPEEEDVLCKTEKRNC